MHGAGALGYFDSDGAHPLAMLVHQAGQQPRGVRRELGRLDRPDAGRLRIGSPLTTSDAQHGSSVASIVSV
jgi:hypothetical protein